jgi:hypothetical protein
MPSNARSTSLPAAESQASPESLDPVDKRLLELRGRISDLGFEMDAEKAGAAAMMGLGVFLLLLAGLAAYDLLKGKAGVWASIGITRDTLWWVAYGFGAVAVLLIGLALKRRLRRDHAREAELARLEEEYASLRESRDESAQD